MVFTSSVFLGIFLPLLLTVYFLVNCRFRAYILLVFSLLFYAWGEPTAVFVMMALIVVNYVLALAIGAVRQRPKASGCLLAIGVIADLGALVAYKYLGFFTENLMPVLRMCKIDMPVLKIALPIGISFYVFQIVSYLIDVRRGDVLPQRNPFKFMLYVSLFPQLIAGPIVRYQTIADDIEHRETDLENVVSGFRRFVIGLAKKVLVADMMALVADTIFESPLATVPCAYAWLGAVAYMLQIYYDFSGYSDMAIGLGRVFNFRFLENFDHPYSSLSVQEFWRRWHISLSSWFRDYLYIPLGGNRKGAVRTYMNLFVVFLLCGFWHGASWNFIAWGAYHGFGLVVERLGLGKMLKKLPKPLGNVYLLLFVLVGWVFFRASNLSLAVEYLGVMFCGSDATFRSYSPAMTFFSVERFLLMAIGLIAAYPIFDRLVAHVSDTGRTVCSGVLFVIVYMVAMTSEYSPFIYFRF